MDARAERTRRAMIEAVIGIVVDEGAAAVTHQRVAERAGVGRATVYRHWSTPDDILLAVFELIRFPPFAAGDGPLETRLSALLRWLADEFSRPEIRAFLLAISERAGRDPITARVMQERMAEFQRGITQLLNDAGVSSSEPGGAVMARFVGPIWFRVLVQGAPADDAYVEGIVSDVVAHLRRPSL